jgi:ATP/ADP translocase
VAIAPIAFAVFAIVAVAWLYAVKALSVKVTAAVLKKKLEQA